MNGIALPSQAALFEFFGSCLRGLVGDPSERRVAQEFGYVPRSPNTSPPLPRPATVPKAGLALAAKLRSVQNEQVKISEVWTLLAGLHGIWEKPKIRTTEVCADCKLSKC